MAGVLESVNQRTQLVGENRLEILLFRLGASKQLYGINVFKVREVLQCPELTSIPYSHPVVRGVSHIRGETVSVLDMRAAIGKRPLENAADSFVIITEYNMKIQGFLVQSVERIVNLNWAGVHPPPKASGNDHYLTAVTEVDDQLVEIIDVEKILAEVCPTNDDVSESVVNEHKVEEAIPTKVLIVDDSGIARKQIKKCVEALGVETIVLNDGRQALDYLKDRVADGTDINSELLMMISDVEMPEMDGYTLTTEVRADPSLSKLHIMLHTSLSGVFNKAMVEKVGANDFLAKFRPDDLAEAVAARIKIFTDDQAA